MSHYGIIVLENKFAFNSRMKGGFRAAKVNRSMRIGDRIRYYRRKSGMSMDVLGKYLGVSRQTVFRYENGTIENIPHEKMQKMAEIFGVGVSALFGFGDMYDGARETVRTVPMLGEIACGEPIYADEEHGRYAPAEGLDADFCLRAKGDSMTGARIFDGDIVFVHAQQSVENGQIGVVIVEDEATLKRVYYYPESEKLVLMPENAAYPPLVYVGDELEHIKIIGRAVAFQSDIR